jgi:hypothetical protein
MNAKEPLMLLSIINGKTLSLGVGSSETSIVIARVPYVE